jgi:hypothetical protein
VLEVSQALFCIFIRYMKKTVILFFLLLSVLNCYGQNDSNLKDENDTIEENEIIDAILGGEDYEEFLKSATRFQFIHVSLDYNNRSYFSGRDIGTAKFNISPQLTYLHSNGLFGGLSGVYYDQFSPEWDYTALTIGYGKNFGKSGKYSWSTSYTRYLYTDISEENPFKNSISLGVEIDNKKKTLGTEIVTTYLFGDDTSFQLMSSTYGVLNLIKTKKYHLKLRPQLNIVVAQQTIQLAQTFTFRDQQVTRYIQNNDFGLINTQLHLPLQCNVGNFDFELGYIINFPTALKGETNLKNTNSFNLSMSYLFDL